MVHMKRSVGAKKKRREVLDPTKGYRGQRFRLYHKAKEQMLHLKTYELRDHRHRRGRFRRLRTQCIDAATHANDITYNRSVQGLNLVGVEVDRRNLAELVVNDLQALAALVKVVKDALPEDVNAPAAK